MASVLKCNVAPSARAARTPRTAEELFVPEIAALFELSVHPGELILRGTLMYWFLFLLLRFVTRRDIGSVGVADILLLVLIADASQNGMAGGYTSVTDGFILVATIAGWNWLLDWAAFRFLSVRRLVESRPLSWCAKASCCGATCGAK